jgi:hypothetical protein
MAWLLGVSRNALSRHRNLTQFGYNSSRSLPVFIPSPPVSGLPMRLSSRKPSTTNQMVWPETILRKRASTQRRKIRLRLRMFNPCGLYKIKIPLLYMIEIDHSPCPVIVPKLDMVYDVIPLRFSSQQSRPCTAVSDSVSRSRSACSIRAVSS